MRARLYGSVITMLMLLIPLAIGQSGGGIIEPIDDMMVNPDANISFPPPVYVVSDSIDIRGTVNLSNVTSYLVEFRPLVLDAMGEEAEDEPPWFPAIAPQQAPVVDDILGIWNTLTARDGLYELRLISIRLTDRNTCVSVQSAWKITRRTSSKQPWQKR